MVSMIELRPYITQAAHGAGLDPRLVEAVVLIESGGDTWAWNPEPKYRYFWNVRAKTPFRPVTPAEVAGKVPPADFPTLASDPDQEWWGQQASWGLMQVMGAVARELGYRGAFLTQLSDSATGLFYGCKKLKNELVWADRDARAALAAYNGGRVGNKPGTSPLRNAAYADKVITRLAML